MKNTKIPVPPLVPDGGCLAVHDGDLAPYEYDTRKLTHVKPEYTSQGDPMWHWTQGPRGCIKLDDVVRPRLPGKAQALVNANFREIPSLAAKVLTVVKAGEWIGLTGTTKIVHNALWRRSVYGPHVGWMSDTVLGNIEHHPDFTHKYPWYLEHTDISDIETVGSMINAVLQDSRGWHRAGVAIQRVSDPTKASAIVRVLEEPDCVKPGASCVRTTGVQSTILIDTATWGSIRWLRVVTHEFGHAMFSAVDTYVGNKAGIDPDTTSSIMGSQYEAGGLVYVWPDEDDIASAKLWLQGRATQLVKR
jgi:hypothetical protein